MSGLRWRIVAATLVTSVVAVMISAAALSHTAPSPNQPSDGALFTPVGPGAIALLATLLLAIPLSGLAVRPLRQSVARLARGAQQIARGGEPPHPAQGWDGEMAPVASALSDLATAVKAQIVAAETERAQLAAILSHMGDGVIMIDADRRIGVINAAAARLLGTSAASAEGHSLVDVARDHELVAAAQRALAGETAEPPLLLELGHPRRVVQVVATSVPPETPGQVRGLLLLQDVTDLRQAETVRQEFVANVSHELRTPVASLKALAETLDSGALGDPPAARIFLARMLLETDRLAQLVDELLELALLESRALTLQHEEIDVGEIVLRAVERLGAHAGHHGVHLAADPCPESALIVGDAVRLERVLVSLLDNAVKFTAPGGEVHVRCEAQNGQVCIAVADTGVGIPAADLRRVFERFYKADRARASTGTGLGLAIAKHTVEAHGGRIWVESVEGHGSTFFVSLPTAAAPTGATQGPGVRQR
jgi:two-component system phosphate regulon sensor histidine kinase PhoR